MAEMLASVDMPLNRRSELEASVGDYIALLKPRVMSLVIFTAFVGMVAAPVTINPVLGFVSLLVIAVGAGASGALNMWYDADIDAKMQRTMGRPVPMGRIAPGEALGFGLFFSGFSVLFLGLIANWIAAGLLAFTIFFYAVIYTMWLKRSTPQNIVIGGAAGAFPPVVGWAAVTGSVSFDALVLFAIIFLWTPPHFWALALYRARDYENAGVPMLPVVAGAEATKRQIMAYSVALAVAGMVPIFTGLGGVLYAMVSLVAGSVFFALAYRVLNERDDEKSGKIARKLFTFSILYLFSLFAVLLVEHGGGLMWNVFEVLR